MEDVKNSHLERGARRALVGLFGEGWCNAEFARLPQKIRDSLLKGLNKRTTPVNVFALLFAAEVGLGKIKDSIEPWTSVSKDMILSARKAIDDVLCTQAEQTSGVCGSTEGGKSDPAEWIQGSVPSSL